MNTHSKIGASMVGGLMLSLAAAGASAQIVASQHDLTTAGAGQGGTAATDEVCVFCHTPHGAASGAPVPLWNKVLTPGAAYVTYATLGTPTLDGTEAPVGSVSLACLSCHDGTQAMDVVINGPGSGNYNPAGSEIDGTAIGVMTGSPVPMLGLDLFDDHPIGIQYCGGGKLAADADAVVAAGTVATGCDDPDFNETSKATVNGGPIWWVNSTVGVSTNREKTDMILYARNEALDSQGNAFPAGQTGEQPFVECGTCHDPHNSSTAGTSSVAFLRVSNTASVICTTCHIK